MLLSDDPAVAVDRQAYLDALLATLPEVISVVDRDLRIIEINSAGLQMIGVDDLNELPLNPYPELINESSRPILEEAVARVFDGDATIVDKTLHLKVDPPGKNQQLHECRAAPVKDGSGKIIAAMITGRDVSKWQNALDVADMTSAILESILSTVPDAMIVIDERGLIASFSKTAEKLFGYEEAEMLGKNVSILMPSPYREEHDGYIARYLKTAEKRIIGMGRSVEAQRSDGTIFPMQLEIGEAVVGDHRLFTGFIHDLTRRRKIEAELQANQAELIHATRLSAVGTLASSLAHELNQPLTAIANYLSAGSDMIDHLPPETKDMLQEVLDEGASESVRAGKIVQRLREFVSKREVTMEVLSMAELVHDATVLGLVGARAKGVEYSFDIDPDINHVLADRVQIQQVMVNLMRNAIEAMQDSPDKQLIISAHSAQDHRVEFLVQDTGPGISAEVADRLFQPFASTKGDGMGLGLSICKTIIEAYDGELTVNSAPGGGAIFRFTLLKAPKELTNAE